ncbi:hypothetical protein [Cellulomonas sp. URHB0016]
MSPLPRAVRRVHYAHYLWTAEPAGMTTLSPMRFATVTGQTYGGTVVTVPVAVVSRAPAPPLPAAWLCVRQSVGHLTAARSVWMPADQVRML